MVRELLRDDFDSVDLPLAAASASDATHLAGWQAADTDVDDVASSRAVGRMNESLLILQTRTQVRHIQQSRLSARLSSVLHSIGKA